MFPIQLYNFASFITTEIQANQTHARHSLALSFGLSRVIERCACAAASARFLIAINCLRFVNFILVRPSVRPRAARPRPPALPRAPSLFLHCGHSSASWVRGEPIRSAESWTTQNSQTGIYCMNHELFFPTKSNKNLAHRWEIMSKDPQKELPETPRNRLTSANGPRSMSPPRAFLRSGDVALGGQIRDYPPSIRP